QRNATRPVAATFRSPWRPAGSPRKTRRTALLAGELRSPWRPEGRRYDTATGRPKSEAAAPGDGGFDSVVAPEQFGADGAGRGTNDAAPTRFIGLQAQALLALRRLRGGEDRLGRLVELGENRAEHVRVGDVAVLGEVGAIDGADESRQPWLRAGGAGDAGG